MAAAVAGLFAVAREENREVPVVEVGAADEVAGFREENRPPPRNSEIIILLLKYSMF